MGPSVGASITESDWRLKSRVRPSSDVEYPRAHSRVLEPRRRLQLDCRSYGSAQRRVSRDGVDSFRESDLR